MEHDSDTVHAVRLTEHGEPLRVQPVQLPAPGAGEVVVALHYAGVNPIDRYIAEGRVAPDAPLPRTLGGEASGELDGRPVLVAGAGLGTARDGVWAQSAVVPTTAVVDIPDGVALRAAAALGVAGLTAINCVRDLASVTSEDRVLVLGASGGVGGMIVSLARALGATVWGQTGSAAKSAEIIETGADRAIVGAADQIAAEIAQLAPTVVFDPLGDGFVAPVVEGMAARGRLVTFGVSAGPEVTFNMQLVYRKALSILGYGGGQMTQQERRPGLVAALEAVRSGELVVRIDAVLGLDQVNEAFQRLVDRRVEGKLLLDLSLS
jgi:NADPH:quinone reductase